MSLRIKFAILILLLAGTFIGSMAIVLWSYGLNRSGLLGPYTNTGEVIDRLRVIINCADEQAEILKQIADSDSSGAIAPGDGAEAAPSLARFDELSAKTEQVVGYLVAEGTVGMKGGAIASRTLLERIERLHQGGRQAIVSADADVAAQAAKNAAEVSSLAFSLNRRVLDEFLSATETVEVVRRKLLFSAVWAFLAAGLLGMLSLILVHRWVLQPVANLRTAANRIAAGDFRHRVDTIGRDELAQLGQDVNHMAGTIESMLVERVERERLAAVGEMVRRLAHNLRNPLAGIRGLAELARDDLHARPDLHDSQQRIIDSVDRFERWLSDLLSVTRPLAMNPERTPVPPLLNALIDTHRPMARTKEITLELDAKAAPAEAVFDIRHLEHSLVAIVTNAIQASPPKSTVRITALSFPDAWEVRIADQGPGVPEELVEKIFTAYFTTKKDGNGIGLAVAQQVVKAHGGRITIESGLGPLPPLSPPPFSATPAASGSPSSASSQSLGLGAGATFVIRIPLEPPTVSLSEMTPASRTSSAVPQLQTLPSLSPLSASQQQPPLPPAPHRTSSMPPAR